MSNQTAQYKGRTYRLLWQGATKYGERAHLQFLDGSKDFWVAAHLISAASSESGSRSHASYRSRRSGGRWTGCSCGSVEGQIRASDCWQCRHDAE